MDDALTLNRRQQRRAMLAALLGGAVPVLLAVVDHDLVGPPLLFYGGALLGLVGPVAGNLVTVRWRRVRVLLRLVSIPGLTMMQAGTGGVASPHTILLVMAMLYLAVRCTSRQMLAGIALTVACCFVPMLVVGAPLYPPDFPRAVGLALVLTTVTASFGYVSREAYVLTRKLNREAETDPMTGLLNRRGWQDQAGTAAARALREGVPATVVLVDLDGLKAVNDALGHDAGDALIRGAADRLRAGFRAEDLVARLGGDEFAVYLVGPDEVQVRQALERVRAITPEQAGFSGGLAVAAAGEPLHEVMRRADLALYEAKSQGGGHDVTAPSAWTDSDIPPGRPTRSSSAADDGSPGGPDRTSTSRAEV